MYTQKHSIRYAQGQGEATIDFLGKVLTEDGDLVDGKFDLYANALRDLPKKAHPLDACAIWQATTKWLHLTGQAERGVECTQVTIGNDLFTYQPDPESRYVWAPSLNVTEAQRLIDWLTQQVAKDPENLPERFRLEFNDTGLGVAITLTDLKSQETAMIADYDSW